MADAYCPKCGKLGFSIGGAATTVTLMSCSCGYRAADQPTPTPLRLVEPHAPECAYLDDTLPGRCNCGAAEKNRKRS